jgi:precorrin-6B methylase 2
MAEAQIEFLRWSLALTRPRVVLEVGTNKGLFPYLVSLLLEGVEVHTVDVRPDAGRAVALLNERQQAVRCVFHEGDSREVLPRLEVRPDFAWLDGGHETDAVIGELLQCWRLGVRYVAVDDTAYPSVRQAVHYAVTHLPCEIVGNPFAAADQRKAMLLRMENDHG